MTTKRTELVFLLDRSGSMSGLESDTIGGYNAMLAQQRAQEGEVTVTTVLFDDRYELLHNRAPLQAIAPITREDYYVRGSTALLDAIGRTIQTVVQGQRHLLPSHRAEKVLFVITTDGMENASREYTYRRVRTMIEQQQAQGWEFLFLGANMDAVDVAARCGIPSHRAVRYHADSRGTRLNYEAVGGALNALCADMPLPDNWKDEIEADYQRRRPTR